MLLVTSLSLAAHASEWPEGLSFVGLTSAGWHMFLVQNGTARIVDTVSEPRAPTFSKASGRVAYIAADGALREIDLATGVDRLLIATSAEQTYAQPAYAPAGDRVFVVALKNGASADTDILAVKNHGGEARTKIVVSQRSGQFEPFATRQETLYYSSIHCTVGCGKIIQEIWRKHLVSGEAEQVTLLNAMSRQPVADATGERLYFSSNAGGARHIWRVDLRSGKTQAITSGRVVDSDPALDAAQRLFFVRRSADEVKLMRHETNGLLHTLQLPDDVTDIRDLRIGL